jgi:hypothetical protein
MKSGVDFYKNAGYGCVNTTLTTKRREWTMKHDWIMDVLADLRSFATVNGLGGLAEQLEDTMLVATAEIATVKERTPAQENEQKSRNYIARPGAS